MGTTAVAKLAAVSYRAVHYWADNGKLPYGWLDRGDGHPFRVFRTADVKVFLEERQRQKWQREVAKAIRAAKKRQPKPPKPPEPTKEERIAEWRERTRAAHIAWNRAILLDQQKQAIMHGQPANSSPEQPPPSAE